MTNAQVTAIEISEGHLRRLPGEGSSIFVFKTIFSQCNLRNNDCTYKVCKVLLKKIKF